jgi:hypothetical protein
MMILYTLMILTCVGNTLLRGAEKKISVKGEVCGNYWINGNEYDEMEVRQIITNYMEKNDCVMKGLDIDMWKEDTDLYCINP